MSLRSDTEGPTVLFTACMHGEEIGGTVILHELFKKAKKRLKRGNVLAFPLVNPSGFETVTRHIPLSKEDLNRAFPGDERGTLAERIAKKIFSFILESSPSLVIDLHNDWNKSIPYVLVDPMDSTERIREVERLIVQFSMWTGLLIIEDTETIRSSLTYNLMQRDIPAIVLELGESFIINEKNIDIGLKSIWNILARLDMVDADITGFYRYPLPERIRGKALSYSSRPLSPASGIIRFLKKPGDVVLKGDTIAKIYNAFGKKIETLIAQEDAIIIGHADHALSFPGSPVMAFGNIKPVNIGDAGKRNIASPDDKEDNSEAMV